MSEQNDVQAALAILRDAGFPVERIRILPNDPDAEQGTRDQDGPLDRGALLTASLDILADGEPHAAKDLARSLRSTFPDLTRKDVNSVLSIEGKEQVDYNRETYTYQLKR